MEHRVQTLAPLGKGRRILHHVHTIGRSRGSVTTKIMALTDALGTLIDLRPLPGQAHDLRGTPALTEQLSGEKLLADRAFDANWLHNALAKAEVEAVIPPNPTAASRLNATATATATQTGGAI